MRFALAFEEDPLAALARFGQLFDDASPSTIRVTLDEFSANAEFV